LDDVRPPRGQVRHTLGRVRCPFARVRCTLGRVRRTLGRVRCTLGRVRRTLGRVRCTLDRVRRPLGRVRCTLNRVRRSLGRVRCTLVRVRCTLGRVLSQSCRVQLLFSQVRRLFSQVCSRRTDLSRFREIVGQAHRLVGHKVWQPERSPYKPRFTEKPWISIHFGRLARVGKSEIRISKIRNSSQMFQALNPKREGSGSRFDHSLFGNSSLFRISRMGFRNCGARRFDNRSPVALQTTESALITFHFGGLVRGTELLITRTSTRRRLDHAANRLPPFQPRVFFQ
jgi:hypothetical protein